MQATNRLCRLNKPYWQQHLVEQDESNNEKGRFNDEI